MKQRARSSTIFLALFTCGSVAALVIPLHRVLSNSGKPELDPKWQGEVHQISSDEFSLPPDSKLKFEPKLSNFGNRVLVVYTDSSARDHVGLWERGVGITQLSTDSSPTFTLPSPPVFAADGNRAAFFTTESKSENSLLLWEDGFGLSQVERLRFRDMWSLSFDPSASTVLLAPGNSNASYIGLNTSSTPLSTPLLLTFESHSPERLLRVREPRGGISYSVRTLNGTLDSNNELATPPLLSSTDAKPGDAKIQISTSAVKVPKTPLDLDNDGASDLLLFATGSDLPYWRGYTLSGIEGATAQISGRISSMATWRVGDPAGVPVPGDYNGDGVIDLATFTPNKNTEWNGQESNWKIYYGTGPQSMVNRKLISPERVFPQLWGQGADIAVPGDYDGDGALDLGVFEKRRGNWQILFSSGGFNAAKALIHDPTAGLLIDFGKHDDIPVPCDYDGNGRTDLGVLHVQDTPAATEGGTEERRLEWRIRYLGVKPGQDESDVIRFGRAGDVPLPADYDGDGKCDVAVYRPSEQKWLLRIGGDKTEIAWGIPNAEPLTADFDGDGKADPAFYNSKGPTKWSIRNSRFTDAQRVIFVGDRHAITQSGIGDIDGLPPQVLLRKHQSGQNN